MSGVVLRPLREDEFAAWIGRSTGGYVRSMVEFGSIQPEQARTKAEHDFAQAFPEGFATAGQHIWAVEDGDGAVVGHVWLGERDTPEGRMAFVYEIEIDEALRGRGYGRAAMLLLEGESRRLGYDRMALNVFGGNEVARGLYASLGYREVAVTMAKDLP